MSPALFGTLSNGRPVHRAVLGGGEGLSVEVLDYGAIVQRITAPTASGRASLVVGYDDLAGYEGDQAYHGPVIGRCANRIGGARFTIDGIESHVSANEGANCLHGGRVGWSKRLWRFSDDVRADSVSLSYADPDGEQGFPGAVEARVTFSLPDPWTLEIVWEAATDRPTPVNLTQHLYFNLSGDASSDILDHEVTIAAERFTPVGPGLIPTGEVVPVEGSPFDFRTPQPIGARLDDPHPQLKPGRGYDHNWALTAGATPAVRLCSPRSGIELAIETDQPGMQMYGGQTMSAPFHAYAAVVFEPQGWPDAVNRPNFPDVVLRPGQAYRRSARYSFRTGAPG